VNHVDTAKFAYSQRTANVKVGKVPLLCGASPGKGEWVGYQDVGNGNTTDLETLESRVSSQAASPSIFSPHFYFSISKPPSYLPISNSWSEAGLDNGLSLGG